MRQAGALGTGLAFFLFYAGAGRSTAIDRARAQIEPAYSLLLSRLALGHRPTPRRLAALGRRSLAGIAALAPHARRHSRAGSGS
jgi:drug/metabolite transporter (DMT)-like permease